MGPVYRAYQPELDRLVAVKLFRLDVPPDRVHRLVAELEKLIAADLTHPAVAAPLATGIAGTSAFLAQDFVAADSLDIVVRDYGPAPPPDAVRVAAQLAGALDFAAVVNATHGALHPRDVLVSPDDTRVTGIGVTRALEQIGITTAVRRPYTAPERAAGRVWDRRADVFSLAALVYELLYGRRITGAGDQAADAMTEIAGANLRQLRAVFARALAEDPTERFDTALEFAEQLKGSFSADAIVAVPRTLVEPSAPIAAHHVAAEPAIAPTIADLDLRQAEAARYEDVESAPSAPEPVIAVAAEEPRNLDVEHRSRNSDSVVRNPAPASRSAIWPIALALILGAAIGAAITVVMLNRDRSVSGDVAPKTEAAAPAPAPAPPAREFTEGAVAAPPQPAPPAARTEAPRLPAAPAPAAIPGRLLVRSTPAGARVFVDGKDAGVTPLTMRDIARGTHTVRVVRDGYLTEERRVAITASRSARSLIVELSRPRPAVERSSARPVPSTPSSLGSFTGALIVDSRPSGATVFVDGKSVGTTPVQLDAIRAGEHAVRIESDGYRRWTSSVRVVAGERNRVTASLER